MIRLTIEYLVLIALLLLAVYFLLPPPARNFLKDKYETYQETREEQALQKWEKEGLIIRVTPTP